MKIVFVCRSFESLAIEYLSACLKRAGHETAVIFDPALFGADQFFHTRLQRIFSYRKKVIEGIISAQPDLIAFSVVSDDYGWACDVSKILKEKVTTPIIFGGIHPTLVPERVIQKKFIDYICVGEGEEAIVELANAIENGAAVNNIPNIWSKENHCIIKNQMRELIENLDSIPFPDKEIYYREYREPCVEPYFVIASRGCPNVCTYCHNDYRREAYSNQKQKYYRRRGVDNVIQELKWAKEKYHIKRIFFHDDIFIDDLHWLKLFSEKYKKEVNLPFYCSVHPRLVNQEAISCLVNAGCSIAGMGIQTSNEAYRKNILGRYESNEDIIKAIQLFKKSNIFLKVDMIIGLPEQNENDLIESINFLNLYAPDVIFVFWLRYYPKSKIIKIAQKMGALNQNQIEDIEESMSYMPATIKGNTFNVNIGKLGNLMLLSPNLPRGLLSWIIRKKIYRYFPAQISTAINAFLRGSFKRMFSRKKKHFSFRSLPWYFKFYFYYLRRLVE